MPSLHEIRDHLLSKTRGGVILALDLDSMTDWLAYIRPNWRVVATIPPGQALAAVRAAVHLALIDVGRISPYGSRRALGHFRTQAVYPCCIRVQGAKPRVDHVHGHNATVRHICHDFDASSCVPGVEELRRVLKKSLVLYALSDTLYRDVDLECAVASLVEVGWRKLMEARGRHLRWTFNPPLSEICAALFDIAMHQSIEAATPTSAMPGSEPARTPVASRRARAML